MCDSSPYGKRDDYLWVRENWRPEQDKTGCACINYQADNYWQPIKNTRKDSDQWIMLRRPHEQWPGLKPATWRPSIHMPRWTSRLTLKITNVRVERLQDISEDDAQAEGIPPAEIGKCRYVPTSGERTRAAVRFHDLWDSINASRGHGWDKNPWVWVICFEVIRKNIDEIAER